MKARNEIIDSEPYGQFTTNITIACMSRALWNNDSQLMHTLHRRSAIAREHLYLYEGTVILVDPIKYAELVEQHRRGFLARESEDLDHQLRSFNGSSPSITASRKRVRSQMQANWRFAKLWCPSSKRLSLHGLKINCPHSDQSIVVREPRQIKEGLAAAWAPTFARKKVDVGKAKAYLRRFGGSFNWTLCDHPSYEQVEAFLRKAPHSASGPDGLPYIAWLHSGEDGYTTLWLVLLDLINGISMPISFNDSATLFPAKGELDDDHIEIVREATDTRPLNLKNTDNKTLTGIINLNMQPAIRSGAHTTQRGFIGGRQLTQNVVDLDFSAREQAIFTSSQSSAVNLASIPEECRIAILAFFDFATAFPSVAHAYLALVIVFSNAPPWIENFVRNLYAFNHTFQMTASGMNFLYSIWSGVLQGCPLSATLFVMCINPFLIHFERSLVPHNLGIVRVCADDIGAALFDFRTLAKLQRVFELAKDIANLTLKPIKCNIIPTSMPHSPEIENFIKEWLAVHLPSWKDFKVLPRAKYLGFIMGPQIRDFQWQGTMDKWA